jgi:glutathione S-transferase
VNSCQRGGPASARPPFLSRKACEVRVGETSPRTSNTFTRPFDPQSGPAHEALLWPQSPFARKVRAAAIELGLAERIAPEYAEVVPGRRNDAFAESRNPLRKIPAFVTDAGETLFASTAICEYLDALAGGGVLIPRDGERRWRVLTNHALAQGMCECVILIRYETSLRPESARWGAWVADHWDKIETGLLWFERNAGEAGGPVDLAQLALGSLLGYVDFRWPERGWRERCPKVAAWWGRLEARPSFAETRPAAPPS